MPDILSIMLKWLTILAAIMLSGLAINLTPRGECQQNTNRVTGEKPTEPRRQILRFAKHESTAKEGDTRQNQTPNGDTTPEWVLVVVGIITAGVICWQSCETRKAAQAAEKGAEAALKQAELTEKTLVLQFRPKVVIRGGRVNTGTVNFTIVNTGGSNAKSITSTFEVTALDGSAISILENPETLPAFDLMAGENRTFAASLREDVVEAIRWADARHAGTLRGGDVRYIYFVGLIWYVDDIGIKRDTGFFRKYSPEVKRFLPVGDPDRDFTD